MPCASIFRGDPHPDLQGTDVRDYRSKVEERPIARPRVLGRNFGPDAAGEPLKVGTALCAFLSTVGLRVTPPRPAHRLRTDDERTWNPDDPDPRIFEDVDAVVHLAGASIAGRFTEGHKQAIDSSRIEPTRRLADAMVRAKGPRVLLAASAIGYYGRDRGDPNTSTKELTLVMVISPICSLDAEAATQPAEDAGLRVVTVRTGVVLSARGGILQLLRPVFLAGLGGRVGDGRQWLSWIDLDDLTDVYARTLVDGDLVGAVNAVAPNPVRNQELTITLGHVLYRPALVPVPKAVLGVLVGADGVREVAWPASGSHRRDSSRPGSTSGDRRSRPLSATSWAAQHQRRDRDVGFEPRWEAGPSFLRRADGSSPEGLGTSAPAS